MTTFWERVKIVFQLFMNYQPNPNSLWLKYFRDSKIPGMKETVQPNIHVIRRIFWLIVALICTSIGLCCIVMLFILIYESPVLLVFDARAVHCSGIPFPSVTWSKRHNLKRSTLKDITYLQDRALVEDTSMWGFMWTFDEATELLYATNIVCSSGLGGRSVQWTPKEKLIKALVTSLPASLFASEYKVYDNHTESVYKNKIIPTLAKGVPKCQDMVKACLWNRHVDTPCKQAMDLLTDIGASCSFNKIPDSLVNTYASLQSAINDRNVPEKMKEFWDNFKIDEHLPFKLDDKTIPLMRSWRAGIIHSFSFIMAFDEDDVACKQQNDRSFYLDIKLPWDIAEMVQHALAIPMNAEVWISLDPVITRSEKDIRRYDKASRGCIFADEVALPHFKFYTMRYCKREALNSHLNSICRCSVISFPNEPGTRLCSSETDMHCVREESLFFSKNKELHAHCLPGCTEVEYNAKIESIIHYDPANPPEEVSDFVQNRNASTAIVHIYFKNNFLQTILIIARYTVSKLISAVGNIAGITNGLSFIDVVRIIFVAVEILVICYFTRRAINRIYPFVPPPIN